VNGSRVGAGRHFIKLDFCQAKNSLAKEATSMKNVLVQPYTLAPHSRLVTQALSQKPLCT
jgi:hypothetical protein